MAIIIETCPKCGHDLHDLVICTYPPIPRKECHNCGWSWEGEREEIARVPFDGVGKRASLNLIVDDITDISTTITEKEIQEYLASALNDIKTTSVNYAKNSVLG